MRTILWMTFLAICLLSCKSEDKDPLAKLSEMNATELDSLWNATVQQARDATDPELKAELTFKSGLTAEAAGKFPQALSIYQGFILDYPEDARMEEAASRMANLLSEQLNNHQNQ